MNGQNRSASFSYAPSYNSYHKGYQPRVYGGGYSNLRNNATGVSNHRPDNQPSESRASPDSSGRPGSSNSNRVANLTGTNLRSGANNRGGRRGGYNNRFQGRHPMQPNLSNTYPRYPGAQLMVPMPYSYYPSALPIAVPPQPGTALLVPDVNCRCYDCVAYFANMANMNGGYLNSGYYPAPLVAQSQVVPQQQNGQMSSDHLQLVPAGSYLQPSAQLPPQLSSAQLPPTFIPYYGSYPGQQQALMYQQQMNMLPVQNRQARNPEPKNELTPIEPPGSIQVPTAPYGDGFFFPPQSPYIPASIQNQGAVSYDSNQNTGQQSFNQQAQLGGQGNGAPGNTFSYTLVDRVIQNNSSSVQSLQQLKH